MNPDSSSFSPLISPLQLEQRLAKVQSRTNKVQAQLEQARNRRLISGLGVCLGLLVATIWPNLRAELPVLVGGGGIFIYYVVYSRRLERFFTRLQRLTAFLSRQKARQSGQPVPRPAPIDLKPEETSLQDLGLFGDSSLWSLIDETFTDGGQKKLRSILMANHSIEEIQKRQNLVRQAARRHWALTRLQLDAEVAEFRVSAHTAIQSATREFLPRNLQPLLIAVLVLWCGFAAAPLIPKVHPALIWAVWLSLSMYFQQKLGSLLSHGEELFYHLDRLAPILFRLESLAKAPGFSDVLKEIQNQQPSRILKKFNRVLAFAGTEANPIGHLIINAIVPWTPLVAWGLERRRQPLAQVLPKTLEGLFAMEALSSQVFLHVYQTSYFPDVSQRGDFNFKQMLHPLLPRASAVANSYSFISPKRLGLLTGSNMSGKSTFLRMVGLNQILANSGSPVFAELFQTSPLKVLTCIQVTDSLRDGYSYFYAEVLRLKECLLAAQNAHPPVLYLIDEIFRGTNNHERRVGSQAVIEALAKSPGIGFVSTHDLELTALSQTVPAVDNLHFREEVKDDHMIFSYLLHPGACPTTNALRIMQAAGLPVNWKNATPP